MLRSKWIWWSLTFIWCALIYKMTATPAFTGDNTGGVLHNIFPHLEEEMVRQLNFFIRKMAHITAFGILAIFVWLAITPHKYAYIIAWLFSTTYGALDELHQSFIPSRSGKLTDVLIDSSGAALALVLLYLFLRQTKRMKKHSQSEY